MRIRTNLIIEESTLAKIDVLAGEKNKRAAVIEKALLEYIAREENKLSEDAENLAAASKTKGNLKNKAA